MSTYKEDQTETTEELWRAWVHKGKSRDAAAARKHKVAAGLIITLSAATAVYMVLARQGSW